jgi:hypothetical protein
MAAPLTLPGPVADLCTELATIAGVSAVTIGGSRATGSADEASDWDVGVYYRGAPDFAVLARRGELHRPGSWGRIMNGGAWLRIDGLKVDVLLRDLDVAVYWSERARAGRYEVDALLGYLAGIPTYSLMAELALNRVVAGALPPVTAFPAVLAEAGRVRWRQHAELSLLHARMRAQRGDVIGTLGQAAKAVLEVAHARLCERREWVLNEKHMVERAGFGELQTRFGGVGTSAAALTAWVEALHESL